MGDTRDAPESGNSDEHLSRDTPDQKNSIKKTVDSPGKKGEKIKDGWDKADIILKPLGGLITAITIAILGFYSQNYLVKKQASEERVKRVETNFRLYSELISKREEAETALRKDMFKSIIDTFVNPAKKSDALDPAIDMETRVLNIELLVYNFHESFNLKPLFLHLKREIEKNKNVIDEKDYLSRLERSAREISRKQMAVLDTFGTSVDLIVDIKKLEFIIFDQPDKKYVQKDIRLDGITRTFTIAVIDADKENRELNISLDIKSIGGPDDRLNRALAEFWVGFFDFPMIDNTRLSHDQRCAIVLNAWQESTADITVIFFPGAYASMQEKPIIQDVVQNLLKLTPDDQDKPDEKKGKTP